MKLTGSCHCKATRFEVAFAPETVTVCSCSNCSKRGALWAYYEPKDVTFIADDARGTYQWNGKFGKYNFCRVCGNSTYNETPSWDTGQADYDKPKITINARLFDDYDVSSIEIVHLDGKNLW
jgi:hypothetical protein